MRPAARGRRLFLGGIVLVGAACVDPPAARTPMDVEQFTALRRQMVERQLRGRDITDERVLAAMAEVPRHEFVPEDVRAEAYGDQALPIGRGQTISQPYVVALMTQLLRLRGGERVLEVGTGSGYQAAVLGRLAAAIYSIEIDANLAASARERLRALGYANVSVRAGDGFFGWPDAAPFDAIIITAAAPRFPEALAAQLKDGGRVVMPLERDGFEDLSVGVKETGGMRWESHGEVRFVPMRGKVRTPPAAQDP